VVAQAAGLAVLAAISPTALLLAAVYLGSAQPRRTILFYLTGALLMSVVLGIIILIALRAGGFSLPHHKHDRYGLRLGLGILLALAGLVLLRRGPRPPDPSRPEKGIVSRLMAAPAPYTAFLAGLLVFGPGVTYFAAVQVVATANADLEVTITALAVVIVINVSLVWLPLVAFLIAPEQTTRRLTAFNAWLRSHGQLILSSVLIVAGIILIINGTAGLIQKG
jgi:Sap, sulfolipid-1-addressing protein